LKTCSAPTKIQQLIVLAGLGVEFNSWVE